MLRKLRLKYLKLKLKVSYKRLLRIAKNIDRSFGSDIYKTIREQEDA